MENNNTLTLVITSGGFDPLHKGHIEYLKKASELGDYHICILNNDNFLKQKKGKNFMPLDSRLAVMSELRCINNVIVSIDDDLTVCKTLEKIAKQYKYFQDKSTTKFKLIFAKGGDRHIDEIPEKKICDKYGITIVDGLGEKIESSSKIINDYVQHK